MGFIRVKEIGEKRKRYAYFVENRWKKRLKGGRKGSRQKVSRYLGRIIKIDPNREKDFYEYTGTSVEDYCTKQKKEIISDLVRYELFLRGFNGKRVLKNCMIDFNMGNWQFVDKRGEELNIVMEMNEGFLCNFTLRKLLYIRAEEDERETGIKLAKAFLEAGLRVPKEIFVKYYEKI